MNAFRIATATFVALAAAPLWADATYTYTVANDQATLTGFAEGVSPSGAITVPASVDDYPVIGIDRGAFKGIATLSSITFADGDSIESIGPQAFAECSGLKSVSLPSGLSALSAGLFRDCSSLTSIDLPDGLTSVGPSAFAGCVSLTQIDFPEGLAEIGESAFLDCSSLTSATLPETVTAIPAQAFAGCRNLSVLSLPSSITTIADLAFSECDSLASIELPESLSELGANAFRGCDSLSSVEINAQLATIGEEAFADCPELETLEVISGNASFSSVDGALFDASQATLILVPPGKSGTYTVPSSVTSLASGAFDHCSQLVSIDLPTTVSVLPDGTFYYATKLASIELPDTLSSIGEWAFSGCNSLTGIRLPDGVVEIDDDAFHYAASLLWAQFEGDSPTVGETVFDNAAEGFTVYFYSYNDGFTVPTWLDYASVALDKATPYLGWLIVQGLDLSADMNADLNGDGVTLILAYALGLDPNLNLRDALPQPSLTSDGAVSLTYYAGSHGIDYTIESSEDLQNWSDAGVSLSELDADQTVTATASTETGAAFLRLSISVSQ